MKRQVKYTLWGLSALLLLLVAGLTSLFLTAFSGSAEASYIYVDRDDTADSVYMKAKALPEGKSGALRLLGVLTDYQSNVRPGRYQAGEGVSVWRLMRSLRGGRQEPVRLVIPVVHTIADLATRMERSLEADSAGLMKAFTDSVRLASYGFKPEEAPCLFIPDTYEVFWTITPEKLVERMKREYDRFWNEQRRTLAKKAGLTPNEVYTLASIVEQESQNEEERPRIAGMYLNRLRQGMKLQADPTVKFALGDFALRRILHGHLTTANPYNTYRYPGLPPGPICVPSLSAIKAVLGYESHSYLYMCAKEDFSGTHRFASSYADHLANARRYAAALNARGIK